MTEIQIVCDTDCQPNVTVRVNQNKVPSTLSDTKDCHGNYILSFVTELNTNNHIEIVVTNLNGYFKVEDILIDSIKFGLVTFLCTTIENQQNTQLNCNGILDIALSSPIWKFWCEKMNSFNYEDYPLGSVN